MFEKYKETREKYRRMALYRIKDRTRTLEERWELYTETPDELLEKTAYIEHFESEKLLPNGDISWYDDFYKDKYETIILSEFIEQLEDYLIESEELDEVKVKLIVNSFKREILEKGLYSFINNW